MGPLNATQIAVEKLTRALAAHVAGKRAQARAAVVEALAGAPSSSFVQIVASRLLFHLGEVHGALTTLAAAEQQAPDERTRLAVLDWIFELGSRGGCYREALRASRAAFAADPQRSSRHAAAAEFHSLLGDHESADRHCRAALAADPRDPARKLASARALRGLGRHTEARELLESVQLERRDARAEVELAQELVLAGAFAAAASRLHAALDAEPSLSSAHAELARLALWRNDLETAGKHARLALDADPRCGRARVVLAGIALFSGAPEACLAELDRALASTPLDPELGVLRVEAEFRRERYAAALEAVTALDAMVPDSAEYFSLQVLRALVSHRLGEEPRLTAHDLEAFAAAVAELSGIELGALLEERGPALERRMEWILQRLGGNRSPSATFLDETGALRPLRLSESSRKASKLATWSLRYRESADIEAELASLAERFPVSPQPFCYRGELRLWLGRYAEARADFEAALARAANTRWAYIGLGASHLLEGRPERALEAFDRGAERTGPGPTLYVYRGEARLRLGQLEPALADLERARSMNPTRLAAYVTLALASGLSGDLDRRAALLAEIGARAPGLVSAAWFELGADHPPAQLEAASEEIPRFLEHLLCMLRGNRSSSLITYFTCDGALRFVPPRPTPDPIVMRSDLERLAHSLAAARRRPELLSG